jgi:hypothetical protein
MYREERFHLAAGPEIDCKGQPPAADRIVAEKAAHEEYLIAIVQLRVQMGNLFKEQEKVMLYKNPFLLSFEISNLSYVICYHHE